MYILFSNVSEKHKQLNAILISFIWDETVWSLGLDNIKCNYMYCHYCTNSAMVLMKDYKLVWNYVIKMERKDK